MLKNILLTGGSGDLGCLLTQSLYEQGKSVSNLDVIAPKNAPQNHYIKGSILDRNILTSAVKGASCIIHIAAWHGIHEPPNGTRDAYDFHDLNVTGTFNVLEAAAQSGIKKFILISSTSVDDRYGIYGHTKILNEEMAHAYAHRHGMDIIILRPRAFIPPWNKNVYANFIEWSKWFWKGAVHINDVNQATLDALAYLEQNKVSFPPPPLPIDGAYDYTSEDLDQWDADGDGSSFNKYYAQYLPLATKYNFEIGRRPKIVGSTKAEELIGYKAKYSLKNLLEELDEYGEAGPEAPF